MALKPRRRRSGPTHCVGFLAFPHDRDAAGGDIHAFHNIAEQILPRIRADANHPSPPG